MQLTSLITVAGLAVSATNAILLPFPPEQAENDIVNALPLPIEVEKVKIPSSADSRNVYLSCPGCPVLVHRKHKDGKAKIKTDIPSHLELDFSIDHASGSDRLMLNGYELYPNSDPLRYALGAKLLPDVPRRKHGDGGGKKKAGHEKHQEPKAQPLGFGLRTQPVAKNEEDNLELILVDLQVIEVGNVFVDGIPNVEVSLIKTPEGGLMIGEVLTTASETIQKTPMDQQEECTTLLCKWHAIITQQLARLRTHKHCGSHHSQVAGEAEDGHPHPGHMHHGHRTWAHLLKNIAAHIILPIAIGIVAGVTASILGMMVGTAIVCLWRTFVRPAGSRRHHQHGHSVHKVAQHETAAADEKSGLMSSWEDAETPPAYIEEGVNKEEKSENDA